MKRTHIVTLTFSALLTLVVRGQEGRGLEFLPKDEYQKIQTAPFITSAGENNPSQHVISASKFPPVRSQGGQGSCTGWAVGYYFYSYYQAAKNGGPIVPFSPSYVFHRARTCTPCNNAQTCRPCINDCGSNIATALNDIQQNGIVKEADFPYDDQRCTRPSSNVIGLASASSYRLARYNRLYNTINLTEMKTVLSNDVPVIVAVLVDGAFDNYNNKPESSTYHWTGTGNVGGHAMVVVGYDDNRDGKGAFKLVNSWGLDFGTNGYFWVDYESMRTMLQEAYIVEKDYDTVIPTPPPPTPPANVISSKDFKPFATVEAINSDRNYYTIGLDMSPAVSDKVDRVTYIFDHPSFYTKSATSTAAEGFATNYQGWGCLRNMKAYVYLDDGSAVTLQFDACDLIGKSRTAITSNTTAQIRPIVTATPDGKGRYEFRVELGGIEAIKNDIDYVTYDRNHPSFAQRFVDVHDAGDNFAGGYEGWGCLYALGVIVHFKSGSTKTFTIDMCKALGW